MAKIAKRVPYYDVVTPEAPKMQEYIDPKLFPGFEADDAGKVLTVNENGEWCCREGGSGGGSAALVFTENQQGELTANMSVEEACNSIRAGMSPMLISQKSGETEIWCFAGGMLGDGWTSVNFRGTGGNTVSVMFDSGMDNPFIAE